MPRKRFVTTCLLWILFLSHAAAGPPVEPDKAGSFPDVELRWSTLDAGGGPVLNAGIRMDATLGQPDVHDQILLQGGTLQLRPGYWGPAGAPPARIFSNGFEAAN